MAKGPHEHNWHYEDSVEVEYDTKNERQAGRYCTRCLIHETLILKEV